MTFLTLPALRDTFAIFGGGFRVDLLATVGWLAECPLIYWGDLDPQGFQILSLLRASFPHAISMMMDEATFEAFREFAVPAGASTISNLPCLSREEHSLCARLTREQLRLEQERISHTFATARLRAIEI